MRFRDREEAGRMFAASMNDLKSAPNTIVLGLPRGGVPIASEVALALSLPLDVLVVRKLGVPSQPELAMGAIGPAGVRVFNEEVLKWHQVTRQEIEAVTAAEEKELNRRESLYRAGRPPLNLAGLKVLLVDDGLATGTTVRAAIEVSRKLGASEVLVGVPVAADDTARKLESEGIRVISLLRPLGLESIGQWYLDFDQLEDTEVMELLVRNSIAQTAV